MEVTVGFCHLFRGRKQLTDMGVKGHPFTKYHGHPNRCLKIFLGLFTLEVKPTIIKGI